WNLVVTGQGRLGAGSATFAIPKGVEPPPALPQWAGWAIALSPLLGLAWFAVQQRGLLRQAAAQGVQV
ncbi:MAG TPA: hypothetical protein VM536_16335, partial [Chloroflexia bacterium]|nr:hypothetical protein [Chloroflexia bacterium]